MKKHIDSYLRTVAVAMFKYFRKKAEAFKGGKYEKNLITVFLDDCEKDIYNWFSRKT